MFKKNDTIYREGNEISKTVGKIRVKKITSVLILYTIVLVALFIFLNSLYDNLALEKEINYLFEVNAKSWDAIIASPFSADSLTVGTAEDAFILAINNLKDVNKRDEWFRKFYDLKEVKLKEFNDSLIYKHYELN